MKIGNRRGLVSWCAMAAVLGSSPAHAQDATQDDFAAEEENTIVVTGIRKSLESAANLKRNSVQIVDAITAEDIGRFPTENVADASQRITGVQITRTRGNGAQVSIRGLPTAFTRVQLNGSTLTSALFDLQGGGAGGTIDRSFDFRTLPTDFVRTLEVSKSPTADQQEGGLSGTINVATVRPLELGKTTFTGSAFGVYNNNYGSVTPRVTGLASTVLADGRLGLLITGGYDRSKTQTHGNGYDLINRFPESLRGFDYNGDGDLADVFNIPGQVRTDIFDEDRERINVAAVIEFKASDSLTVYAEGFYGKFDTLVDNFQNLHIFTNATGGPFPGSTFESVTIDGIDPSQLIAGAPFATVLGQRGVDTRGLNRQNRSSANTYYAKGGIEFENDVWTANATVSYSKSDMVGDNLGLAQIARFDVQYDCSPGEQLCGITLPAASEAIYLDPRQPRIASLNGAFGRQIDDTITELQGNIAREFEGDIITRISFGAVASWRETFADATAIVVGAPALASVAGLERVGTTNSFFGTPYGFVVGARRGDFLSHYNGSLTFPTQWVTSDTGQLLADVARADLVRVGTLLANETSIIDVTEDILAAYVRADFGDVDAPVSGNAGVRVVRTSATMSGFSPNLAGVVVNVDAGGVATVPPAGPVAITNTYTEILPSFNLKLNVTDNFVLRFGASRTMARPTLSEISPSTTIAGAGTNFTISTGNPSLEPFISLNFDATAEWYPNADTTVTLALFTKDLATLIRDETSTVFFPIIFRSQLNGTDTVVNQQFQQTRPANQEGVTLRGAELGVQQFFSFLPGPLSNTGMQANYTYISNSDPNVLTAASKHNFNVSAFYEDDFIAVRGSYTWRDSFVTEGLPDGQFGLGLTQEARGNLDVNLTLNITDFLSIVAQGTNVLNNADISFTTLGNLPQRYFDVGAQYMVGARFKF